MSTILSSLNEVFLEEEFSTSFRVNLNLSTATNPNQIEAVDVCTTDNINKNKYFLGCCKLKSTKTLHNVVLHRGTFYHTLDSPVVPKASDKTFEVLPVVKATFQGKELLFKMYVSYKRAKLCTNFYNGTLHVIDMATMHNMFHLCKNLLCESLTLSI